MNRWKTRERRKSQKGDEEDAYIADLFLPLVKLLI